MPDPGPAGQESFLSQHRGPVGSRLMNTDCKLPYLCV